MSQDFIADDRHEFGLIRWLQSQVPADSRVPHGIGDDAAFLAASRSGWLVTTDMLMEGVDFLLPETVYPDGSIPRATWELAGRKALAVSLSDIAAMGGEAVAAFLSIALPKSTSQSAAQQLLSGVQQLAAEYDVCLAGGDTNSWNGPLVLNTTVLGHPIAAQPVLRSGAQSGDAILLTGPCGGSLAGRHLTFPPRLHEARWLIARAEIHAMLDLSDGLAQDLGQLCRASQVGARIESDCIPITAGLVPRNGLTPLEQALYDGEDFELLLAVSEADAQRLLTQPDRPPGLTRIGQVTAAREMLLVNPDGTAQPLSTRGWVHTFGG